MVIYGGVAGIIHREMQPEPVDKEPKPEPKNKRYIPRPVVVDGEHEYPSVNAAAKALGCIPGALNRTLSGQTASYKGHTVKYADEA